MIGAALDNRKNTSVGAVERVQGAKSGWLSWGNKRGKPEGCRETACVVILAHLHGATSYLLGCWAGLALLTPYNGFCGVGAAGNGCERMAISMLYRSAALPVYLSPAQHNDSSTSS